MCEHQVLPSQRTIPIIDARKLISFTLVCHCEIPDQSKHHFRSGTTEFTLPLTHSRSKIVLSGYLGNIVKFKPVVFELSAQAAVYLGKAAGNDFSSKGPPWKREEEKKKKTFIKAENGSFCLSNSSGSVWPVCVESIRQMSCVASRLR